jgi:hypothetical protein
MRLAQDPDVHTHRVIGRNPARGTLRRAARPSEAAEATDDHGSRLQGPRDALAASSSISERGASLRRLALHCEISIATKNVPAGTFLRKSIGTRPAHLGAYTRERAPRRTHPANPLYIRIYDQRSWTYAEATRIEPVSGFITLRQRNQANGCDRMAIAIRQFVGHRLTAACARWRHRQRGSRSRLFSS